ncbi:MAG: hypothetical protein JNM30_16150 [Rhodospirillales bacterium]|nr:hypothetical protein [Rhodospirillales bacterium]
MQALTVRRLAALAAALVLSGCGADFGGMFGDGKGKQAPKTQSRDQVPANTIMGTVESDGAQSVANVRVELYEITGRDPVEAVTKGEPLVVTRSQRDGSYYFNLGTLARAPQGQSRTWLLRTGGQGSDARREPESTITFTTTYARGRLPPLYLWDGAPKIEESDDRFLFRLAPLPAARRTEPLVYGVELASAQGGQPLLPPQSGTPVATVPRLILQELPWTYRPVAGLDQPQADGTIYRAAYRGAARQIQGMNPPPLTRARDAKLIPPGLGFRGLTDGKLDNMLPHTMPAGGRVEIDLGSVTELGAVFLAGLEVVGNDQISVHLGTSPNQLGPTVLQVPAREAFEIKLPPGARGRFLAVSFAGQVTALAEVVAYPPMAAQKWEAAKPVAPFSNQVYSAPVN